MSLTHLLAVWLVPSVAAAHVFGRSFSDVKPTADEVGVFVDFDPDDLEQTLRARFDADRSGEIDLEEMEQGREALARIGLSGVVILRDEARCDGELVSSKVSTQAKMLRLRLRYTCDAPGSLTVRVPLLEVLRDGHTHLMTLRLETGIRGEVLTRERQEVSERQDTAELAWRFFVAGVEHIVTGYDHLAFLLGLLLVAHGWKQILMVVTSFTLAHSVTLVLGGLGVVEVPPGLVEPAIAASIDDVGVENLWRKEAPRYRPWLTFGLGLIHGFGFASLLSEMGLPAEGRVVPLVCFNLGVEVGQVAVVLVVLPLVRLLERRFGRVVIVAGSVLVAAAGLFWLVSRLVSGA